MKRCLFFAATVLILFFVTSGVLWILGDALMQKDVEIERLQDELESCRESRLL